MAGYVVNQIVQKIRSEAEKHWGILLFGVRDELAYITDELASMSAFLDEAQGVGERAKVKREWIRQVRELAHDAEDCIDEFRRRLVQPTDQQIVGGLLRTSACLLRASGADTHFLRLRSRLLSASSRAGTHLLRGAGYARMLGTRGTTRFRRISARLLPTGAGIELGTRALRMGTRLLRTGNARYWLAVEIKRIKAGVDEACKRAQKFGFISTPSNARAGDLSQHPYRLNAIFTQDSELVGVEEHRDNLIKILLDEDMEQTRVISVVGCAGLGKTTLVRRVFENQRIVAGGGRFGRFDCRAWITVSSSFELMGFLKKVFHGLSLGGFNQELGEVRLIEEIRAYLRDKRYVIIFDDVWTSYAWQTIELVFPVNMRGSRIVVTTRDEQVAYTCVVNNGYVYKAPSLSPEQSMRLFCRRVFDGQPCPRELESLSTRILKKCDGVPLLIGAIAGILAGKPTKTVADWKCMLDHLGSGLTNHPDLDGAMQIMALSYDALPSHLKRCFLYLGVYPEDYEIERNDLLALWIAEGLVIGHSGEITLEELAESYFNELICRNLIKVGEIIERTGKVRTCLVHDVMHAFAVTKSAEEENLAALSGKHNTIFPQGAVRHLSLHTSEYLLLLNENMELDHLRSLLIVPEYGIIHSHKVLSFICRSRFLRVLDLRGLHWLTSSHIEEIGTLYHLKYLNLRNTRVERIPESFGNLPNLEALDVGSYCFTIVPAAVVIKLPKLRHLRARCIEAPHGPWSCKTLVTLDCLCLQDGSEGVVREMRNLTQLRKLGVEGLRPTQGTDFCAALSEMSSHLRCLKVYFDAGDTVGYLDSLASPPLLLQHLQLDGYLGKLPVWISSNSLEAVSKICLYNTRLQFDAIQTLQKLPNLIELILEDDAYIGKELHLHGDGFSRLSYLRLENVPVESLDFGVGSVPRLEELRISGCGSLREIGKFDGENLPGINLIDCEENQMQLLKESLEAHPFMFVRNILGFERDLPKPREM